MNVRKVISEFKIKYLNKRIIENKNSKGITTEIICEVKPYKTYSHAIDVIDFSVIHYHKKTTETYKVLRGDLKMFKYDKRGR